jgi:hypothetical protein
LTLVARDSIELDHGRVDAIITDANHRPLSRFYLKPFCAQNIVGLTNGFGVLPTGKKRGRSQHSAIVNFTWQVFRSAYDYAL